MNKEEKFKLIREEFDKIKELGFEQMHKHILQIEDDEIRYAVGIKMVQIIALNSSKFHPLIGIGIIEHAKLGFEEYFAAIMPRIEEQAKKKSDANVEKKIQE